MPRLSGQGLGPVHGLRLPLHGHDCLLASEPLAFLEISYSLLLRGGFCGAVVRSPWTLCSTVLPRERLHGASWRSTPLCTSSSPRRGNPKLVPFFRRFLVRTAAAWLVAWSQWKQGKRQLLSLAPQAGTGLSETRVKARRESQASSSLCSVLALVARASLPKRDLWVRR